MRLNAISCSGERLPEQLLFFILEREPYAMSTTPLPPETDCRTCADKLKAGGKFVLIDCREQDEYNTVHIDGAVLLPMNELANRVAELEPYRDHDIAIHCHHGG